MPTKAESVVSAAARELAEECEIQLSYAIGVSEPISILVDTFGTGKLPEEKLEALVEEHFDLSPQGIIDSLDLLRPIYSNTARHGHFGRTEPEFSWEQTTKADILREAAGLSTAAS